MQKHKFSIVIVLMLAMSFTMVAPAAPAYAASISDLVPQLNSKDSSSGGGIFNILFGLLIGKLFSNTTNSSPTPTTNPSSVLGSTGTGSATGQALIATGQKYMGVPYVWGGTTTSGFDCSGFTQYVMKENGITIPRTAAEQYATGTAVEKSNLKVGDLVFFTTYKPGASHVGFYMGNGKFLHASSAAKQVTVNSLSEQYYVDHYIGARSYF